jgi:hypothetical protein
MYKKIIALLFYTSLFTAQTIPPAQYFLDHFQIEPMLTLLV